MSWFKRLTDGALSCFIKGREATGATGRTDAELHAANCEQTDRLSNDEIAVRIAQREAEGRPTEKLRAAARDRAAPMSDAQLSSAIKQREASGATGRTDPVLHRLNCEQTGRLSNSDIASRIAEREAQGLPTGKLRAAARDRGLDV